MKIQINISWYFKCMILMLCVSCSTLSKEKQIKTETCNENLKFKKVYFENIQNVENLITKEQNESFHKSLKFISKYSKVSFREMLNYAHVYGYGTFERDKTEWLKWYEGNKCNNIQFKDTINN